MLTEEVRARLLEMEGVLSLEDAWDAMFQEGLKEVYGLEEFREEVGGWRGEGEGMTGEECVRFLDEMQ